MSNCFFSDIHSHFLFGVDDGAKNLRESLRLIEQAQENNIHSLLATPHVSEAMTDEFSELIIKNFENLKNEVLKAGYKVDIHLAAEILFNDDILSQIENPWATVNGEKKYLLFELPFYSMPLHIDTFIFDCQMKGITPILAHPERYYYFQNNIEVLLKWRDSGCLMQMDAGSIIGQFGKRTQNLAKRLAKINFFYFVASDAHNVISRNYKTMYDAYDVLKKISTGDLVDKMFCKNPAKVLAGESISPHSIREETVNTGIKNLINKFFSKNNW